MKFRTMFVTAGRGTGRRAIVGLYIALTVLPVGGLAADPALAEVGTRPQNERNLTHSPKASDKTSYLQTGGAQFFGPLPPKKASANDGFRFIHTDPYLHDGHRPYRDVHQHPNIADGGALIFSWTFDK